MNFAILRKWVVYIANITLQRGGIWNLAPRNKFKTHWKICPWCLKAKFQIPHLRSVMFAVNTTTRATSNLDYLQFCSPQPIPSPGSVHQKFEWVFKILSEFSNFEWVLSQTPRFFQTPRILSGIWLKFWNFEALIWVVSGVNFKILSRRTLSSIFCISIVAEISSILE